jgi:hypothetical protein
LPPEIVECNSDSDVMGKAKELLAMSTTFRLMEVWQAHAKSALLSEADYDLVCSR